MTTQPTGQEPIKTEAAPAAAATPPTSEATPPAASTSASTEAAAPSGTDLGAEEPAGDATGTDLGAEDEPADAAKPNEFHGFPETGTYGDFTLPDGMAADPDLAAEFTPIAKELNLSQKGAQRLVELKAKDVQLQLKRWGNHLGELKAQAQKDPVIGGANYKPAVDAGRAVITKFGTPGFRKMLNDYGVGAHPEMIHFLAKVHSATSESPILPDGGGTGVTAQKPLHEILYKDMK